MAITDARCNAYKLDLLNGVHQPDDEYKLALYTDAAALDKWTKAYSPEGEVQGGGYPAGGLVLERAPAELTGDRAELTFAVPVIPVATITADGGLVYNATRSNKALRVVRFENAPVASTNGPFRATLPPDLITIE